MQPATATREPATSADTGSGPVLQLYGRGYCHLCDEMVAALRVAQTQRRFDFCVVDVDADPALEERLGEWVPVLMDGDREICRYRLDLEALDARLSEFR